MPIGFNFPYAKATGSLGFFSMTENVVEATKNNIFVLAVSNWGERINRYDYGWNFSEFLFEQRTEILKQRMKERIIDQTNTWIPYVFIKKININFAEDDPNIENNSIKVDITWSLNRTQEDIEDSFLLSIQ